MSAVSWRVGHSKKLIGRHVDFVNVVIDDSQISILANFFGVETTGWINFLQSILASLQGFHFVILKVVTVSLSDCSKVSFLPQKSLKRVFDHN